MFSRYQKEKGQRQKPKDRHVHELLLPFRSNNTLTIWITEFKRLSSESELSSSRAIDRIGTHIIKRSNRSPCTFVQPTSRGQKAIMFPGLSSVSRVSFKHSRYRQRPTNSIRRRHRSMHSDPSPLHTKDQKTRNTRERRQTSVAAKGVYQSCKVCPNSSTSIPFHSIHPSIRVIITIETPVSQKRRGSKPSSSFVVCIAPLSPPVKS
jgi:hypothetical protein